MQTNRSNVYQKKEEERQETSFCPGQKTGKEDWSDYFRYCISYREASLLVFRIFSSLCAQLSGYTPAPGCRLSPGYGPTKWGLPHTSPLVGI